MSWNWGVNLATPRDGRSVTGAESVSSLFSASGAGSYVTVAGRISLTARPPSLQVQSK